MLIAICIILIGLAGEYRIVSAQERPNDPPPAERIPLKKLLQTRIDAQKDKESFTCSGELVCGIAELPLFYRERDYRPAWYGPQRNFTLADQLLETIRSAAREGLRPEDYHLKRLEALLSAIRTRQGMSMEVNPDTLMDTDILLSDAFLLLGSHFRAGRVNPVTFHATWSVANPHVDMARTLKTALKTGRVAGALKALRPPHDGYAGLRQALAALEALHDRGGWIAVPPGPTLRPEEQHPRVALLRKRLEQSGDMMPRFQEQTLPPTLPPPDYFDTALAEGVTAFQARHGLVTDAAVGKRTLAALNVPIEDRIRQVRLNMERWRWIPDNMGRRHIRVNIADFSLTLFDLGRPVLDMRVVVGRKYRKTPVFSAPMKYIVLNPFWNVPYKLAVKDILPKLKKDVSYASHKGIRIYESWDRNAAELDPTQIDWSQVSARNFPYRLRQDPSARNSLGRIKFMFPNKHAVYLHDTPSKRLFQRARRGFSSGCIRLQKPFELGAIILDDERGWNQEKLLKQIEGGKSKTVRIQKPVMVHLLYWTAWRDARGRIHFREDIYKRDKPLDNALRERKPRA